MYVYKYICIYYMDKGILMRTKTLVILIRHYIRDLSGVFPVCHYGPMVIEIINNTRGGIVIFFTDNKRERVYWGANPSPGCRAGAYWLS